MNKINKIAVIGAGINGLCSMLKLLQSGYQVDLFAQDFPPNTWSDAASAVWMQFKAHPMDKVTDWLYKTHQWCQMLQKDNESGVNLLNYREYHHFESEKPYFLSDIHFEYQSLPKDRLKGYLSGFSSTLYRLDSRVLLPYLVKKIKQYDGQFIQTYLASFQDRVLRDYPVIINCTGAANHCLTKDKHAFPISGQYLLLEKVEGLETIHLCILDDANYIAIVPRTHDIWLGGSTISNNWASTIDPDLSYTIQKQCMTLEPRLQQAKIIKAGIGFRSGRNLIRVERECIGDITVIHNYGQGGSGFSLCWGCAEEVASLIY